MLVWSPQASTPVLPPPTLSQLPPTTNTFLEAQNSRKSYSDLFGNKNPLCKRYALPECTPSFTFFFFFTPILKRDQAGQFTLLKVTFDQLPPPHSLSPILPALPLPSLHILEVVPAQQVVKQFSELTLTKTDHLF